MPGDVKVAVVSGAISSSGTGTADFTKSGFGTPKACIVLLSFDIVDDTSSAVEGKASIGFSDFTNHHCITHQDEDASAKVDCDARKSNTKAYVLLTIAAAVDIDGIASTITDGVRLTNTTNGSASAVFATVIMFGGADLRISLDSWLIQSVQNDQTPFLATLVDSDLVFFIATDISSEDSSSTGINNSFGVVHIDTADHTTFVHRCISWSSDHNNANGTPHSVIRNDRCLSMITEAGGLDWGVQIFSTTVNGYTLVTRDNGAGAGMEVYALSLDLDDRKSKIGSVDSPISGASWTPSVALGFTPQYVGLGVTHAQAENTIESDADAGGLGISSNTGAGEETFHGWYTEDAAATINTNNNFRSRVLDFLNDDVTTIIHDHSHSSFNSGDWTYTINTENETTARKWFYWAIEEAAAAGPFTATGAQTFPSLTMAGVGVMQPSGSGVQTLPSTVQDGVGEEKLIGSGAQTLPSTVQAGAGEEKLIGSGAQTLPSTVQDGVGVMQPSGSGAQTLPSTIQDGVGEEKLEGSGIQTLPSTVQDGIGVMQPSGTGAQTLPSTVQVGAGEEKLEGSGAQILPSTVQAGVGEEKFEGSGVQTLPSTVQDGVGVMQPSGTGAQILPSTIQAGVGEEKFEGSGVQTLPSTVQDGVGVHTQLVTGTSIQTLPSTVQAGVGRAGAVGNGVQILPSTVQVGVGELKFVANGAQTLPSTVQAGVGELKLLANGAQTFPSTAQAGVGRAEAEGAGAQTLPSTVQAGVGELKLVANGAQALPSTVQAGVGVMQPSGTGVQTLPSTVQDGAGVHTQTVTGTGTQTLPSTIQNGVGVMQPSGTGAQTLPSTVQAGVGEEKFIANGAQTFPSTTQAGAGEEKLIANGAQTFPSITQAGVGEQKLIANGVQTFPSMVQDGVGEQKLIANGIQVFPSLIQSGVGVGGIPVTGTGVMILPSIGQFGRGITISFVREFIPIAALAANIAISSPADITIGGPANIAV